MGKAVNKSFKKVRKDIFKRAENLLLFLEDEIGDLQEDKAWTCKQSKLYDKLSKLCCDFLEEVENLDEVEVPEFKK
jgi:hypothetical protein